MRHQITAGQPGCGRPVKCLSPRLPPPLSPLAQRFPGSLPLRQAWQCPCTASVFCRPAPPEQSKALMFPEEALVESSFLLAWEPGLLPVNKSHEKNGLGKPPAGLCPFAENLAGPFC